MPLFTRFVSTSLVAVAALLATSAPSTVPAGEPEQSDDQQECPTYVDARDREAPEALALHGVNCFEAGQYQWALTHYRRAYDLDPDPFLLGGIGRSLHELGLYEPAMEYYQQFLDQEPVPSGADRIRERVEELESALETGAGTVSLRSAPPNTTAYVVLDNGEWFELGETPLATRVRAGDLQLAFRTDSYRPRHEDAGVSTDETTEVDAELVSEDSSLGVSARSRRRAGLWTGGASLLAGAAGTTLLVVSAREQDAANDLQREDFEDLDAYQRRHNDHLDTAARTRRWGTVTTAMGVTGLLTGSLLVLSTLSESPPELDDPPDEQETDQATGPRPITPTVGADGVGVRVRF